MTLLRDPKAVCELSQAQDFSFERHILWKQFGVVSADVHGVIQHAAPSEPIQQRGGELQEIEAGPAVQQEWDSVDRRAFLANPDVHRNVGSSIVVGKNLSGCRRPPELGAQSDGPLGKIAEWGAGKE